MNTRLLSLLGLCLTLGLHAQAQATDDSSAATRSPDELSELLGPIALYPDPLISLILPASTVPSDIVLADRFAASGDDPAGADDKPWDSSVKALVHYPDTLKWLDDNLDWTSQLGDAFISQPVDVMEAIQALRAKAKSLGNLVDTQEERVVQDDNDIRIIPTEADAIYVPTYDSSVVYEQQATTQSFVDFSPPYVVGPWLGYDFDWHRHHLYRCDWHRGWDYSRGHDREVFVENHFRDTQVWHVDSKRRQIEVRRHASEHIAAGHGHIVIAHPKPLVIAHGSKGEKIRRPEVIKGGKPVAHTAEEIKHVEKGGKGHVITPKTGAPGVAGEMKPKGDPKRLEEKRKIEEEKEKGKIESKGGSKGEPKHIEEKRKMEPKGEPKGEPKRIEEKRKVESKGTPKGEPKHIEEKHKVESKGEPKRMEEKHKVEPKAEPKHIEEKRKVEPKHVEEKRKPEPKHVEEKRKPEPKKEAPAKGRTESKDGKKKDKKEQ